MHARLIHQVKVEIQNIDHRQTVINKRWGEAETAKIYEPPIIIEAQVKYYTFDAITASANGFQQKGDGYILVYPEDAKKIEPGAYISMVEGVTVEYYVCEKMPVAHYDVASLWKVFFKSKEKGVVE